jgi:hypothetical protein
MQRGLITISGILTDDLKKTTVKHVRGVFSKQRDHAVMCRLYYHFKIKGLRYDVVISLLNQEFYIGETTLTQIIMRERDLLEKLKSHDADRKYFQKELPHYSWF